MLLQSTFTWDSHGSPASLFMCQRLCVQIGRPQSHNATLAGEWMSKAMVGTMDVLVLCLDFTVYSKDYKARKQLHGILGTAQQFALNHKPPHLRATADEGGFAESRVHNYISVIEVPKQRIPCSPSGPLRCRESKQRAQGHNQEVG